jgi:hypothetical protein
MPSTKNEVTLTPALLERFGELDRHEQAREKDKLFAELERLAYKAEQWAFGLPDHVKRGDNLTNPVYSDGKELTQRLFSTCNELRRRKGDVRQELRDAIADGERQLEALETRKKNFSAPVRPQRDRYAPPTLSEEVDNLYDEILHKRAFIKLEAGDAGYDMELRQLAANWSFELSQLGKKPEAEIRERLAYYRGRASQIVQEASHYDPPPYGLGSPAGSSPEAWHAYHIS